MSADKLNIISAPLSASSELTGIGAHKSSHISTPKVKSGVLNNPEVKGHSLPAIVSDFVSILSAEVNHLSS